MTTDKKNKINDFSKVPLEAQLLKPRLHSGRHALCRTRELANIKMLTIIKSKVLNPWIHKNYTTDTVYFRIIEASHVQILSAVVGQGRDLREERVALLSFCWLQYVFDRMYSDVERISALLQACLAMLCCCD